MIDHDYQIITKEVPKTSGIKHFIAQLQHVFVIQNGERIAVRFPRQEFSGETQGAALILASDALRDWLNQTYPSAQANIYESL